MIWKILLLLLFYDYILKSLISAITQMILKRKKLVKKSYMERLKDEEDEENKKNTSCKKDRLVRDCKTWKALKVGCLTCVHYIK